MIPPKDQLTICFAHAAYQMKTCFDALNTGIASFELRDRAEFDHRAHEADVIVVSGMWHNGIIKLATKLRFIQSIGSGTDQFDKAELAARGIRLASAAGVNARAVSEHAISLILALARRLPEARDNQAKRVWRGMIGDLTQREDELTGKTLLIIGLGRIGGRLAQLAKAFEMNVIGFRSDPANGRGAADLVHTLAELRKVPAAGGFRRADLSAGAGNQGRDRCQGAGADAEVVVPGQCRPRRMRCRAGADRGAAVRRHRRRGAGLHRSGAARGISPLWAMPNVFITPHTGGETRKYEGNVNEILVENLERMWSGETTLRNQIV